METSIILVFARISSFIVSAPFPGRLVPPLARLALAIGLTAIYTDSVTEYSGNDEILALFREIILGLIMGSTITIMIQSFAFAGEIAGEQMGLRMPGFANPLEGNSGVLGGAFGMISLTLFVLGNGPLYMLGLLYKSFEILPVGVGLHGQSALGLFSHFGSSLFSSALEVAAPMIAAVFAAQMILAVLARSVPTLNLFIEGPTLTTSCGIVGMLSAITVAVSMIDRVSLNAVDRLLMILQ